MSALPPEAHTYLRRATRLLLPRAQRAAHAELHAYLHGLMHDALVRGLPAGDAWPVALRAAGPVWPLALRLAAVHTLPPLRAALLVGAALGGAAYAVQAGGASAPALS
ncbi:hypothetical protein K7W42_05690 [Deinococcus sp. HMF7604]|uniref:hypothetical protein n=1 Tax=Deinococcus betulae TaxID=2873312 RepID=UPI001CCE2646|nr:hypothetical protein [Deinococcus betulae]MBZ9750355.1 hypothetical protein [Deinococcus betulae]